MSEKKYATIKTLTAFKKKQDEANALKFAAKGDIKAASVYSVKKLDAPTDGYLASYQLTKDGSEVGAKIDIPKDFLVKEVSVETYASEGAAEGLKELELEEGDKYIDFVINAKEGTAEASHLYLAVKDLVKPYTAGDGIEIDGENKIKAKVDTTNGLSVAAGGIALSAASAESAGAMSNTHYTKLEALPEAAEVATKTELGGYAKKTDLEAYTNTTDLDSKLEEYAKTEEIEGTYAKTAELDGVYVKEADLVEISEDDINALFTP